MSTMSEKKPRNQTPRRNEVALKVYCLPVERASIELNARLAGESVSRFLRAVGMGIRIHSVLDQHAVLELSKINADQGRLGGLLKALLTNDERLDGYTGQQIQALTLGTLRDIKVIQASLQTCVQKIMEWS